MSKRICLLHRESGYVSSWGGPAVFDLGAYIPGHYGQAEDKAFFTVSNWGEEMLDLHLLNPCYHRSVIIIAEGSSSYRVTTFNSQHEPREETTLLRGNGGVLKARTFYNPTTGLWDVRVNFY